MTRALTAILLIVAAAPVAAQDPPLRDLSLEELMRVEIKRVFGASERLQPVTEAPSSVTIVTADEIARYGYRTLADILRGVRGFYVSDDRNYSYIGARGFSTPGDYNTRVLLLVNGHRVNDNVFDHAAIGAELGLDPATFERVEVIRGPASALYGTSAFFAVVNVVTTRGASISGVRLQLDAGSLGMRRAHAMAGTRTAAGVDVAASATYDHNDGVDRLYFPAFDFGGASAGTAIGLDGEAAGGVYGRVAFGGAAVTGAYGWRDKDVPTASFGSLFNSRTPSEHTRDVHAFVHGEYVRTLGRTQIDMRAAFDRVTYDGRYPYAAETPGQPPTVFNDGSLGLWLTLAARATRPVRGRQTITLGTELRRNVNQDQWLENEPPGSHDQQLPRSSSQAAFFLQDQLRLRRWLMLDLGVRWDRYTDFQRATPRGAIIVMPSTNASLKYLYGRAFRAPNAYEMYYYPLVTPLAPESIDTHEVVWEQYVGEWLRTSSSAYWYRASRLITLIQVEQTETAFDGLAFENAGRVNARGVEFEAEWRSTNGVQAQASYAYQRALEGEQATALPNSPRHLANARISIPGPVHGSFASIDIRSLSRRSTPLGTIVSSHAVANLTMQAPITRSLDLLAAVRNLFDRRFADPASDEHVQDAIEQNGRTFRIGIRWKP